MPHPELFGAVVALVVAAAYFILKQRWKRRATDDDDGPGWQLMPPGRTAPNHREVQQRRHGLESIFTMVP